MVYTSAQVAESRWAPSEGTTFDEAAGLAIVPSGAALSKGDVQADVDLILPGRAALIEIASTASTYDFELVRPDVAWGITFESGRITRGSSDGL